MAANDRASYVIDKRSGTVRAALNGAVTFMPAEEYAKLEAFLQTEYPMDINPWQSAVDTVIAMIRRFDLALHGTI